MTPELRLQILARAAAHGGACECGCGKPLHQVEVDHFFGRAKAEETIENCWALLPACHFAKTRNSPSADAWLAKFMEHCDRHGYTAARHRAQLKKLWSEAKTGFKPIRGRGWYL